MNGAVSQFGRQMVQSSFSIIQELLSRPRRLRKHVCSRWTANKTRRLCPLVGQFRKVATLGFTTKKIFSANFDALIFQIFKSQGRECNLATNIQYSRLTNRNANLKTIKKNFEKHETQGKKLIF